VKKNKYMTKLIINLKIILLVSFFGFNSMQSQSIAPQSINSSGAKMTKENGSLSFTLGELVVLSHKDIQGNTLGAGFTARAALTTSSIQEADAKVLDVNVFPNPTSDLVNIRINYATIKEVLVSITDIEGKEVYCGSYAGVSNIIGINTMHYAPGTYFLALKNNLNHVLGSYKIIKQ